MTLNECPACGEHAELRREIREITIEKRTVAVEHEFLRCEACDEEYFTPEQMDAVMHRAAEVIRRIEGSPEPAEIQALRTRLGYTQPEFETVLGMGAKTVTRWERGTVPPSGAAKTLLRVFERYPSIAHSLAEERGIRPTPRDVSYSCVLISSPCQVTTKPRFVTEPGMVYGVYRSTLSGLIRDWKEDVLGEMPPSLPHIGPSWRIPAELLNVP